LGGPARSGSRPQGDMGGLRPFGLRGWVVLQGQGAGLRVTLGEDLCAEGE
jgi:hypothetical protein